jgi:hypothetical protein
MNAGEGRSLRIVVPPAARVVVLFLLLFGGFVTGIFLSQWGARLHPVPGWEHWYLGTEWWADAAKEFVPDTPGAIRVFGKSSQGRIWDVTIGQNLDVLQPNTQYRLSIRLRAPQGGPALVSIVDRAPPYNLRGLMRYFTPTDQWRDYVFDFRTPSLKGPAGVGIRFGNREFEMHLADFKLESVPPRLSADELPASAPLNPAGWSMFPVIAGGTLSYPESPEEPVTFHRRAGSDHAAPILEYRVDEWPIVSDSAHLELQLSASVETPVECRLERDDVQRARIEVLQTKKLSPTTEVLSIPLDRKKLELPFLFVLDVRALETEVRIHRADWKPY